MSEQKIVHLVCISRSGVRWIIPEKNHTKTFIERNMCGKSDHEIGDSKMMFGWLDVADGKLTCFRWFFRIVPSGSGSAGISSGVPVGGVNLFESKSTNQMSSGNLQHHIFDLFQFFIEIDLRPKEITQSSFYTLGMMPVCRSQMALVLAKVVRRNSCTSATMESRGTYIPVDKS